MKRFCALALVVLMPEFGLAQTSEPPLIQLQPMAPAATTPAADPSVSAPLGSVAPTADAQKVPEEATEPPQIELAPSAPSVSNPENDATPLPGELKAAPPLEAAIPVETATDWLLALVPAEQSIPTEVRIGGSLPQPGEFRLTGETATADFVLTLPEGDKVPTELLLSLRSSANVLPDTSYLTVRINGTEAGKVPLDNIGAFAQQRLPTAALSPGVNRITLTATQTHRIFCGPEASFGLWTEVALGRSGVEIDPATLALNSQGFLAAMHSQIARGGSVEILVDDNQDVTLIRDVAGRITDAIGGAPKIEVLPFYSMEMAHDTRARIALISAAQQPKASFRRGADGAFVLQIEHAGGNLPDLSAILPVRIAEPDVPTLTPGHVTSLTDLGRVNVLANTHYFRQDVNFLLPEDWLLLASQKAQFTLHYGFSADLAQGALLLIKVNGQTVRLLPLDRKGGTVQPPLDIVFRANRLNPGVNTLTFEMSVPGDPPDLPCTPRSTDMLVVLADSTLDVPPSPKMRQTDMSRSLARLSGADIVIPPEVAKPARDTETLIAFGALLRPLVSDTTKARLHIVDLDGVGLVPTGSTGVTRRLLQNAVYPSLGLPTAPTTSPDATLPAAPASSEPAASADDPGFSLSNADGIATSGQTAAATAPENSWSLGHFFSTEGWLYYALGGVRDLTLPGTISLFSWLDGKSGEALLLQLDPDTPDDIWLIAGPNLSMNDLAQQVDSFRRVGRGEAHGQAALLLRDGSWVTWSEKRRPELLEPLTIWNLRTVLGNYASWSPSIFTMVTLVAALLSVIPALLFVLITRRSGSRT
ncbi:MAG: putative cellulose synthase [Cypionkella sp.]|uniref:cellulose biosynthesis cyclic di-GMP-binding regulatory protein BcsB n=1 Tax=Cypionkella sp. TaxID=2811411 RepID=UPI00260389F5|nr:cellulose biosynthesis cyclic di-GMP-binding regulatory protein BcsB [Cypionkella sp.]MDB5658033.1 putative cellulose synthase [Cypionkella sp.]